MTIKKGDLAVVFKPLCEHDNHVGQVFTVGIMGIGEIGCLKCMEFQFDVELIGLGCGCMTLKSHVKKLDGLTDEEKLEIKELYKQKDHA